MLKKAIDAILDRASTKTALMCERAEGQFQKDTVEMLEALIIVCDALSAKIFVMDVMHGPDGH